MYAGRAVLQDFALRGEFLLPVEQEPNTPGGIYRGELWRAASFSMLNSQDPRLRGVPLGRCAALPARKSRRAWVQSQPAPLGACVGKNCSWRDPTSAPEFDAPTLPVQILAGQSETGPYKKNEVVLYPP